MASVWKMNCPIHNIEIVSDKTLPINGKNVIDYCPMFYCDRCGAYYIHTDVFEYNQEIDYAGKRVINVMDAPFFETEKADVICNDFALLKAYSSPFIPETCYKDTSELKYSSNSTLNIFGHKKTIEGYFCPVCNDFYIEDDLYEDLEVEFEEYLSNNNKKSFKEEHSNKKSKSEKYSFSMLKPLANRKSLEEVKEFLVNFESMLDNYRTDFPFSLIHYVIMFRRFDVFDIIISELSKDELAAAMLFQGPQNYEWITPLVCAKWNLNFLYAFDEKNGTQICKSLEDQLEMVDHIDEVIEYSDVVDKDGKDVFSIFWGNIQPMLDVIYYKKQELASMQVNRNSYSIVMDEVGTGKTVSALYGIRDRIQECQSDGSKTKILIVCPHNKREDWQNDIRRQLGRYAHIVEQDDNGMMYDGNLKNVFFKDSEHIIMICGQKQGKDTEGSNSALKGTLESYSEIENWDLVIIDEAHLSFDNYKGITAERVMLLTATPIVVNSKGKRTFDDYIKLINGIINKNDYKTIEPINTYIPNEDNIYVNWFREDMEKSSAERKIRFVSCKRWKERDDAFYQIKDEKGALAALQYDQDDDYLFWAVTEHYGYGNYHEPRKNGKIERLITLLKENQESYIIFCEHQFVVDMLFTALKDIFVDCIVAEKYGKYESQYGLGGVQEGQLINTLMQALRQGNRVLFITTGKTGGTGLNLGEFGGVIHYELPFTSIELEQRFGRVDRIDTIGKDKVRDMIFLLNECDSDDNDMEINRMLYYCTTKIDVTCQYMPIRNTVLYYPEFIKRNGKAIRESLEWFRSEYVLSEENERKMKDLHKKIRLYEKNIKAHEAWPLIENPKENMRLSAIKALSSAKNSDVPDELYELMNEYLEYWKDTKTERNAYQRMYRKFLEARKNANNWLAIIGLVKVQENSEIFVGYESKGDGEDQEVKIAEGKKDNKMLRQSVQKQISDMIALIDKSVFDEESLLRFSSEGIFCYTDGKIKRSSVEKYREGYGWN